MEDLLKELIFMLKKFEELGYVYSFSFDHDTEQIEYTNEKNMPEIVTIVKGENLTIWLHKDIH
jgi:hypothetical protein